MQPGGGGDGCERASEATRVVVGRAVQAVHASCRRPWADSNHQEARNIDQLCTFIMHPLHPSLIIDINDNQNCYKKEAWLGACDASSQASLQSGFAELAAQHSCTSVNNCTFFCMMQRTHLVAAISAVPSCCHQRSAQDPSACMPAGGSARRACRGYQLVAACWLMKKVISLFY